MNSRPYTRSRKGDPLYITPGYLAFLVGFRDFIYQHPHHRTPDCVELALHCGKKRSTAAQALAYLVKRGFLVEMDTRYRPWLLSELGQRVLRRADKAKKVAAEKAAA